jgi:hypothetical protein
VRVIDIPPATAAVCWRAADQRPVVRRMVALAGELAAAGDSPARVVS